MNQMGLEKELIRLKSPPLSLLPQIVRVAAFMIASRLDFTLEEVEDLRIAVDEACSHALLHSPAAGEVEVKIYVDGQSLEIIILSAIAEEFADERGVPDSLSRLIMEAVVDSFDVNHQGDRCKISLRKTKGGEHAQGQ